MKLICFLVCYLLLPCCLFAQQDVHELVNVLDRPSADSEKMAAYIGLVSHYQDAEPDSALYYGTLGIQYASNKKSAPDTASTYNYDKPLALIYGEVAGIYKKRGQYKEALSAQEQLQKLIGSPHDTSGAKAANKSVPDEAEINRRITQLEEISTQRDIIIGVAIAFLAILIVLLFFYGKTAKLNKKMSLHEKELRDLNAMKDKLFSVIGHDLRGPIARIPAIIDIYEDEGTNEEEKKFLLDNLREHTKASLETFDKLLYWGLSLVKGIRMHQVKMNPKGLVTESIELRRIKAVEKQITITDTTPADLYVYADLTHFDFIIRNLLANALKYTYPGGIIEITAETVSKPGFTVFSVKDNGMGIDPLLLPLLFKPLKSSEGTANEKGNGIGLMLCKEFAVQNGGDLWVESEHGKGATFFFSVMSQRKSIN